MTALDGVTVGLLRHRARSAAIQRSHVGSARVFSSRDSYNVAGRRDFVVLEVQFHCFLSD